MTALTAGARRDIEKLAKQIHRCCSDKKQTSYQKRVACGQLVEIAAESTDSIYRLAQKFPEPFREIAAKMPSFPCLFPASSGSQQWLKEYVLNELNLAKHHSFKFRAARGRKTFSTETWVNDFLIWHVQLVSDLAAHAAGFNTRIDSAKFQELPMRVQQKLAALPQPLSRANAKQWLDLIWELLVLIPAQKPENHPRLRQLVERPSLRRKRMRRDGTVGEKTHAHNIRAAIKAKLGLYLGRMLNYSPAHK